jgi:hypothetical protein
MSELNLLLNSVLFRPLCSVSLFREFSFQILTQFIWGGLTKTTNIFTIIKHFGHFLKNL